MATHQAASNGALQGHETAAMAPSPEVASKPKSLTRRTLGQASQQSGTFAQVPPIRAPSPTAVEVGCLHQPRAGLSDPPRSYILPGSCRLFLSFDLSLITFI